MFLLQEVEGEDGDADDDSEPAEDMEAYEMSGMLEEDTVRLALFLQSL